MIRSMTGFGRAEGPVGQGTVMLELRSVNNRHLDVKIYIARTLNALESSFTATVRERIQRGRVDVFMTQTVPIGAQTIALNETVLQSYLEQAESLRKRLAEPAPLDAVRLMQLPNVMLVTEPNLDEQALWVQLKQVLDDALDALLAAKESEGARLAEDFRRRLALVAERITPVDARKGEVSQAYLQRLRARLDDFLGGTEVDEQRLAHEVAIFADRCDITEEIVRLRAHLEAFHALLDRHDDATTYAPLGKEIDFLLQEMFREINTIGSKANDMEITAHILQMKSEVERMREQAQNVE